MAFPMRAARYCGGQAVVAMQFALGVGSRRLSGYLQLLAHLTEIQEWRHPVLDIELLLKAGRAMRAEDDNNFAYAQLVARRRRRQFSAEATLANLVLLAMRAKAGRLAFYISQRRPHDASAGQVKARHL